MSHTTYSTDAAAAIERSESHDEIVTIMVNSVSEQRSVRDALIAASDADNEDWTDNGLACEVWGWDDNMRDDEMRWRVHVQVADEDSGED